jgi:hypothetical protein
MTFDVALSVNMAAAAKHYNCGVPQDALIVVAYVGALRQMV